MIKQRFLLEGETLFDNGSQLGRKDYYSLLALVGWSHDYRPHYCFYVETVEYNNIFFTLWEKLSLYTNTYTQG